MGIKEFADLLGWDKARLSTKYSRQQEGRRVKYPIPKPVKILAATPIWTVEQAEEYKKSLEN